METSQTTLFKKIAILLGSVFVFLFPLAFSTIFSNVFDMPKKVILFTIALIAVAIWTARSFIKNKVSLAITPFTLPLIGLSVASLISSLLTQGHFMANLYGKTGIIIAFTLIFLALTTIALKKLNSLLYSCLAISFILSWISIFAYLEFLPKILPLPIASSKAFNPLGGPLASASFLAIILPVSLIIAVKTKDVLVKTVLFVVSSVQAVALIFLISLMLPGQTFTPTLLPFSAGWSITVDMLKTVKTAFLGVGPDNFMAAYTRFKPIFLNVNDKLWAIRFGASSNEFLTIAATMGILGLISFLWLTGSILKTIVNRTDKVKPAVKLGLGLILLAHLLIPANLAVWFLTFIFVSLAAKDLPKRIICLKGKTGSFVPKLVNLSIAAATLAGFYALLSFVRADLVFTQSLKAAAENKGTETYNLQIKALQLNPFEAGYRIAYSNTNLALANSLAGKKDITDEDRKNISQLVSQSIREAKTAVALNPKNVLSWENLAVIYRNLINFAQGADQWAISSYIEAIRLDPINPRLRTDLGGLFYALGDYDSALDQFKRAADFKPDYANAYYNLSAAYKEKEDNVNAFLTMQKVVELIDKDSQDFDRANVELAELKELLPEKVQTATAAAVKKPSELKKPQPLPSPKPAGEVKFNPQEQERLAPPQPEPQVEESPAPTPTE